MTNYALSEAVYLARAAWVRSKQALRLPVSADRNFFVEQFVRHLEAGRIHPETQITVTKRGDGAGAQAQAKLSAMALAKAFNLTYVHAPFWNVAHPEDDRDQWTGRWEQVFGLGRVEGVLAQSQLSSVEIEDFLANPALWKKPALVATSHYNPYCDRHPEAYAAIRPALRASYLAARPAGDPARAMQVAIHVRRGDVSKSDGATRHRFTKSGSVLATIAGLKALLADLNVPFALRLYSQGVAAEFQEFLDAGTELRLDTPAIETFHALVAADVLVMARSAFSFTAALLSDGVILYDPYPRAALPAWIVRAGDGTFPRQPVRAAILGAINRRKIQR